MPVSEMLERVSSAELTEWSAYEKVTGPLGQERDDLLAALVALVVANFSGSKKKHKLGDFVPEWDRRPQTPDEQLNKIRGMHAVFSAMFKDKQQ